MIKSIVFDIDGTVMPQGGPIDERVARLMRDLQKCGVLIGPATGKGADYARGLACGIGVVWDFMIPETGALVVETLGRTPPVYKIHQTMDGSGRSLSELARIIDLNPLSRTFEMKGHDTPYRPELKECILTLFPAGSNLESTLAWEVYFQDICKTHDLNLTIQRHGDGCIDILPSGTSKRIGVDRVCQIFGHGLDEILTAVDGTNDLELVIPGTACVTVANAVPRISEAVSQNGGYLSQFSDGKGFADGIRHYAHHGMFEERGVTILSIVQESFPDL